jgi:hypothetical protein
MLYSDRTGESQHAVIFLKATFHNYTKTAFAENAASTFLTVSTNIIVTTLITFRLLRARRALAKVLPSADMQLYTGVITILIESAAPLTIFGIVAAALQSGGSAAPKSAAFYVFNYVFQGLFYSFCVSSSNQR